MAEKKCTINNTWRFTYLFITTVSISYRAAHTQSLLFLFVSFSFFASVPLLRGFTWTLLFRCWFIRFNLDINHAVWWMMHGIFLAMSRTSKCWHHMGRRAVGPQSIFAYWKCKIVESTLWLRWVISAYFQARVFAPLTYLIFANSFWTSWVAAPASSLGMNFPPV